MAATLLRSSVSSAALVSLRWFKRPKQQSFGFALFPLTQQDSGMEFLTFLPMAMILLYGVAALLLIAMAVIWTYWGIQLLKALIRALDRWQTRPPTTSNLTPPS
ncbi:hypothetical protein Cflav_PD1883 [Pedosphaera parvula Ellin514]|uniref:Uncharacterized protein n=1 Tax=Pedosphaera parvula (strain Ellin514) TaxID=320771 RepID=B9XLD2_PEDPL|nr:hypothetical protein Cflav_PD1883 [Pedosphaera parvula Ellin514]